VSAFTYAWQNIESGLFEYWSRVFGSVKDVQGFSLRTLPKTLPERNSFIWRLSLNGGQKTQRQNRAQLQGGAWTMNGLIELWADSDATAMMLGGMIMEHEPVTEADGIAGLQRMYATDWPSREPDVIRLAGDDDAGQEILCVRLTVPIVAAFYNTDRRV